MQEAMTPHNAAAGALLQLTSQYAERLEYPQHHVHTITAQGWHKPA
jgi:hypothetical protein